MSKLHTEIAHFKSRSVSLLICCTVIIEEIFCQIMSSSLASQSSLTERILNVHVFVQKCEVIKLVSFSDVVQEMPYCSS